MKSYLKALALKWFFRNQKPNKYQVIRISADQILESVALECGSTTVDISKGHCIVCQNPFFLAVYIAPDNLHLLNSAHFVARVKTQTRVDAKIEILLEQKIELKNKSVTAIFKIKNAACYQFNFFHQFLLLAFFLRRMRLTYLEGKIYSAMYSYPRRVIIVSYKDREHCNIFPMDFQCFIPDANIYILGLRTRNVTLEKIKNQKKVVISDTHEATIDTIYDLGKHHSKSPPSIESLPFGVMESELFKFPVPDFSASYREVSIIADYPLGGHTLLIGEVLNAKRIREGDEHVHHVHFFQFTKTPYTNLRGQEKK